MHFTRWDNHAQPELHDQYSVWWDEIRNALLTVGEMRPDTNLSIATDLHPHQRKLEAADDLAPPQDDCMIDECHASLNAQH